MNTLYLMPNMRQDKTWVATPVSRFIEASLGPDTDDEHRIIFQHVK